MTGKSQSGDVTTEEMAEDLNEFRQQPFWKRVGAMSAGFIYIVLTRFVLPALAVGVSIWALEVFVGGF